MGMLSRGSGYNSGGLHHAMVDEPGDDLPLPATDSAAAAYSPVRVSCSSSASPWSRWSRSGR
jgi:hypothetical protein